MKQYSILVAVLLLLMTVAVNAQNENNKVFWCYKSKKPSNLGDKFSVFTDPAEISQFPRYEILAPVKKTLV